MKIAITGHRPDKLDNDYELKSPLIKHIKREIITVVKMRDYSLKNVTFITGMALGIDTLFARIAIELNIPFIAAIPFSGQERRWPERSQKVYREILARAQEVKIVVPCFGIPENIGAAMQKRNVYMVDNSDLLIAVWDGSFGGTCNCKSYAEYKGREIVRIDPDEIREIISLL